MQGGVERLVPRPAKSDESLLQATYHGSISTRRLAIGPKAQAFSAPVAAGQLGRAPTQPKRGPAHAKMLTVGSIARLPL